MISAKTTDVAARAKQLYDRELRAELEANHLHEFVAIEPDSGEWFLGDSLSAAIQAARAVHSDRLAFAIRIGSATAVDMECCTRETRQQCAL